MVEQELIINAFIVFWVIGFTIQELSKKNKKKEGENPRIPRSSLIADSQEISLINDKAVVPMIDAEIVDGRLKGNIVNHPKLGDGRVRTSSIIGMKFDEKGTTFVETRNTVYMVELKGWLEIPKNHPSLDPEGNWWN